MVTPPTQRHLWLSVGTTAGRDFAPGHPGGSAGRGVVDPQGLVEPKTTDTQYIAGFFLYELHAIYVSRISGKRSSCVFGTEFSENLMVFGPKNV